MIFSWIDDVLDNDHYKRYQLRFDRIRCYLAYRFFHYDRRYHAHFGSGKNEGDRYLACYRCFEEKRFEYV